MQFNSTLLINCFHHIVASAINVVLRSELLRILFRIATIAAKQSICRTILIILVSLILFLIKLIESLTSIRKTVPRVLCGEMSELRGMNVELGVGMTVWRHVIGNNVHRGHLMLLLPLHTTILEPKIKQLTITPTLNDCTWTPRLTKS